MPLTWISSNYANLFYPSPFATLLPHLIIHCCHLANHFRCRCVAFIMSNSLSIFVPHYRSLQNSNIFWVLSAWTYYRITNMHGFKKLVVTLHLRSVSLSCLMVMLYFNTYLRHLSVCSWYLIGICWLTRRVQLLPQFYFFQVGFLHWLFCQNFYHLSNRSCYTYFLKLFQQLVL